MITCVCVCVCVCVCLYIRLTHNCFLDRSVCVCFDSLTAFIGLKKEKKWGVGTGNLCRVSLVLLLGFPHLGVCPATLSCVDVYLFITISMFYCISHV